MFITGECKKCKGKVVFDIENLTKEEVEELLAKHDFGHCSVGFHVEMGKMKDYYILNWDRTFSTEKEAKDFNKIVG